MERLAEPWWEKPEWERHLLEKQFEQIREIQIAHVEGRPIPKFDDEDDYPEEDWGNLLDDDGEAS